MIPASPPTGNASQSHDYNGSVLSTTSQAKSDAALLGIAQVQKHPKFVSDIQCCMIAVNIFDQQIWQYIKVTRLCACEDSVERVNKGRRHTNIYLF